MDSLKTRLYTNITHEFRTPLTVMLGMAKQIPNYFSVTGASEKIKTAASLIERNGNNLLQLVNQLLDLSKLESGNMVLDLIRGDVTEYINYLVESFHSLAETKNIRLHYLPEVEGLFMDYSPEKLQHIISNLLSNAIKFTPDGGDVYLNVGVKDRQMELVPNLHREDRNNISASNANTFLSIQVKDTGIGIPPEKIPYIFDRFYQADNTHTRQGKGTGIGLALVKELVKLMDGEITVDSNFRKGAIFTVLLPIVKGESTPTEKPDMLRKPDLAISSKPIAALKPLLEETTTSKDGELPVLLIVEDNEDVAHYIRTCLENSYQVLYAINGQTGIDKAIEAIPDIIISDVMMPEKDGFELVNTLKNDERTSHIPIVLLTAKADVASKLEGLERGADAYLAKPFHQKELLVRLRKMIELRKQLQVKYGSQQSSLSSSQSSTHSKNKDSSIEEIFLQKVNLTIEQNMGDNQFGNEQLSQQMNLSEIQLYRKLKALTGKSIAIYIRSIRLQRGKELLETSELNISEIAYEVGFSDPNYFSRTFSQEFGVPPSDFRK